MTKQRVGLFTGLLILFSLLLLSSRATFFPHSSKNTRGISTGPVFLGSLADPSPDTLREEGISPKPSSPSSSLHPKLMEIFQDTLHKNEIQTHSNRETVAGTLAPSTNIKRSGKVSNMGRVEALREGALYVAYVPIPHGSVIYETEEMEGSRLAMAPSGMLDTTKDTIEVAFTLSRRVSAGDRNVLKVRFFNMAGDESFVDVIAVVLPQRRVVLERLSQPAFVASPAEEIHIGIWVKNTGNIDQDIDFRIEDGFPVSLPGNNRIFVGAEDSAYVRLPVVVKKNAVSGNHSIRLEAVGTGVHAQTVVPFRVTAGEMAGTRGESTKLQVVSGLVSGDKNKRFFSFNLRTQLDHESYLYFDANPTPEAFLLTGKPEMFGPRLSFGYSSSNLHMGFGAVTFPYMSLVRLPVQGEGVDVSWRKNDFTLLFVGVRESPVLPSRAGLNLHYSPVQGTVTSSTVLQARARPLLEAQALEFEPNLPSPHRLSIGTGVRRDSMGTQNALAPSNSIEYSIATNRFGTTTQWRSDYRDFGFTNPYSSYLFSQGFLKVAGSVSTTYSFYNQMQTTFGGVEERAQAGGGVQYQNHNTFISLTRNKGKVSFSTPDSTVLTSSDAFLLTASAVKGKTFLFMTAESGALQTAQTRLPMKRFTGTLSFQPSWGWVTAGIAGERQEGRASTLSTHMGVRLEKGKWTGVAQINQEILTSSSYVSLNIDREIKRGLILFGGLQSGHSRPAQLTIGMKTTIPLDASLPGRGLYRSGTVFVDKNRNGIQERDEQGVPNVVIRVGATEVRTNAEGTYRVESQNIQGSSISMDNSTLPLQYVPSPSAKTNSLIIPVVEHGTIKISLWEDVEPNQLKDEDEGVGVGGYVVVRSRQSHKRWEQISENGSLVFSGLPEGDYDVISLKGLEPYSQNIVTVRGGQVSELALAAPSSTKPVKIF